MSKHGTEQSNQLSNLNLLYTFYCKLNHSKMKHRSFDDVHDKTSIMDLHQFMTFCQDFQITAKQHVNNKRGQKNTHKEEKRGQGAEESIKSRDVQIGEAQTRANLEALRKEMKDLELESVNATELGINRDHQGEDVSDKNVEEKKPKIILEPVKYLNQKTLSEVFKKYATNTGQLNFEQFSKVMKIVASKMYEPVKDPNKKAAKTHNSQNKLEKKKSNRTSKVQGVDYLQQLLVYLKIDSSQDIYDIFKEVNEKHGHKDYLAMKRSPIKKIKVSDPLGRYAGLDNGSHSRLVQASKKIDKIIKSNTLPIVSVASNKVYKPSLQSTHEEKIKSNKNKQNIESFLNKNKSQIDLINKNYESRTKVTFEPVTLSKSRMLQNNKINDVSGEKREKKYSERHKDRIMGNAYNKQLSRLIDTSELYSDDIFNKYLQINHTTAHRYNSKRTDKTRTALEL